VGSLSRAEAAGRRAGHRAPAVPRCPTHRSDGLLARAGPHV